MKKTLTILLTLALLIALLAPVSALAAPTKADTLKDFMAADSDQFTRGVDNNSFQHKPVDFADTYALSIKYLDQLAAMEPDPLSEAFLTGMAFTPWRGSCFGVAATMVLNKLTDEGLIDSADGLYIDHFQSNAEDYSDLTSPKSNIPVLDMINYYFFTQLLPISEQYNLSVPLTATNDSEQAEADEALKEFIATAKANVDSDKPFVFVFSATFVNDSGEAATGGHATVGCDYWIDDKDTAAETDDVLYVKTYDENNLLPGMASKDVPYSYLEIKKDADGEYSATQDCVKMYYYNAETGKFEEKYKVLEVGSYDIASANKYVNIEDPKPASTETEYEPTMWLSNIDNCYSAFKLTSLGQVSADDVTTIVEADETIPGVLLPTTGEMQISDAVKHYQFLSYDEDSRDLELTLFSDKYRGYKLKIDSAEPVGFIMGRNLEDGTATFSSVSGTGLSSAEYDVNGRLLYLNSGKGATDLDVITGTTGEDDAASLMMTHLYSCSYLNFYDETDSADFKDCFVIHSDGLKNGFTLQLLNGSELTGELFGYADKNETWIKVKAEKKDDQLVFNLWFSGDVDTKFPVFNEEPDLVSDVLTDDYIFPDVPETAWYKDSVYYVLEHDIMAGKSPVKFDPEASLTRAEAIQLLYNLSGDSAIPDSGEWYSAALVWAKEKGISDGTSLTENVTREQLVTMVYRYAQLKELDVSVGEDTNILSFEDADSVSDWAIKAMQWACGVGALKGSDGKLLPMNGAARAETAAIIQRFCESYKLV